MLRRWVVLTLLTLLGLSPWSVQAFRHGYPMNSAIVFPGLTFKNIKTDYGASCNGTGTGDAAAFASWLTFGISQGATQVGLIIPPGSNCLGCQYVTDTTTQTDNARIQNAVIWAFGATCTTTSGDRLGTFSIFEDTTHSSLINTANLNDTSVTLVTSSESSRYATGDWLLIGALELQAGGFPPNFQFYQFVQVTNVNSGTGVISISTPINSSWFKSTYPAVMGDVSMPLNGPVSIFRLYHAWDTNLQIFGLTTAVTAGTSQTYMTGRSVTCTYCSINAQSVAVTVCSTCTILNSLTSMQEVDKLIVNYSLINSTVQDSLLFQSPSPSNMIVTNSNIGLLNGWPLNAVFTNTTLNRSNSGANGFGSRGNFTFTNSPIPAAQLNKHLVTISDLTYNNDGTFSILKTAPNYLDVILWAVPGFQYEFSDNVGSLDSTPKTAFTINDVTDQGTSIKIWTNLPNTLPTPSCSSSPCVSLQAYGGAVITQTNSGPADVTQYAP